MRRNLVCTFLCFCFCLLFLFVVLVFFFFFFFHNKSFLTGLCGGEKERKKKMANKEVLWKTDMVRVEALSSLSSLEGEGGKKGGVVYVLEFCDGKENRMNFHFLSLFLKGFFFFFFW